jgi:phosphoglycolate phosphatase
VLFDLDGTLLDTAPDLVGALNHVRALEDLPPVPLAELRPFVSQGALGLIRAGMPAAEEAATERRRRLFLDYYERHSLLGTAAFEGVEELLLRLENAGLPWAVVTNKPEYLTHPILEAVGWARRAACVVCGDTLPRNKPHPDPVLLACERSGAAPGRSLMVGDDPRDLLAARAAGSGPVLAAYGYGARAVLESGDEVKMVAHLPGDVARFAGLETGGD